MQLLKCYCLLIYFKASTFASNICSINDAVQTFEILEPQNESTVVVSEYYMKMSATVYNIEDFQKTNSQYSYCISSILLLNEYNNFSVFEKCNLVIFDEHSIPGYVSKFSIIPVQTHLIKVKLMHSTKGKLCESEIVLYAKAPVEYEIFDKNLRNVIGQQEQSTIDNFLELSKNYLPLNSTTEVVSSLKYLKSLKSLKSGSRNIVIGIKSFALNIELRNAIRETWFTYLSTLALDGGDIEAKVAPFFIVGESKYCSHSIFSLQNKAICDRLKCEQNVFGDLLLKDEIPVLDSYHKLTEKSLSFVAWATKNIASLNANNKSSVGSNYMVLCDDDVYLDMSELIRYLKYFGASQRFYAGEVLEERMQHAYKPQRNPLHANYLPYTQYPMTSLPPLALGNMYIMSFDLAMYLTKNKNDLQPVGTLEDLSMAVWFLSLQVFPRHMPGVCDLLRCLYDESLFNHKDRSGTNIGSQHRIVAVSGLRTASQMHALDSIIHKRLPNDAQQYDHWLTTLKQELITMTQGKPYDINSVSNDINNVNKTIDTAIIDVDGVQQEQSNASPHVINVIVTEKMVYAATIVQRILFKALRRNKFFAVKIRYFLFNVTNFITQMNRDDFNSFNYSTMLYRLSDTYKYIEELSSEELFDVLHGGASHSKTLLTTGILELGQHNEQSNDKTFSEQWVHGRDGNTVLNSILSTFVAMKHVFYFNGENADLSAFHVEVKSKLKIMIFNSVTDNFLQVSVEQSTSNVQIDNLYFPTFVSSFAELEKESEVVSQTAGYSQKDAAFDLLLKPAMLLQRDALVTQQSIERLETVAYLYSRCDRIVRETFFKNLTDAFFLRHHNDSGSNVFSKASVVVALGKCRGINNKPLDRNTFQGGNYLRDAIKKYVGHKFVICFENANVAGYITEKLTNAYLSGSVPIYYGAPDVNRYFHPKSMINCANYETLVQCAAKVVEVHSNSTAYNEMLSASVLNGDDETSRHAIYASLFTLWSENNEKNESILKLFDFFLD